MSTIDLAMRAIRTVIVIGIIATFSCSTSLLAQVQPTRTRRELPQISSRIGTNRSARSAPVDATKAQQLVYSTIKETLEITDEQWTILGPKIGRIVELQAELSGTSGGALVAYRVLGSGDFTALLAGRDPAQVFNSAPPDQTPKSTTPSNLRDKTQKLQDALDRSDIPASELQQRTSTLRDARRQAQSELDQARKDLIELLSARQEAALLQMGLLE